MARKILKDNYDKYEKYAHAYCKCGHSIFFLRDHFAICEHCGKKVYPSKKSEFIDKLKSEMIKKRR